MTARTIIHLLQAVNVKEGNTNRIVIAGLSSIVHVSIKGFLNRITAEDAGVPIKGESLIALLDLEEGVLVSMKKLVVGQVSCPL